MYLKPFKQDASTRSIAEEEGEDVDDSIMTSIDGLFSPEITPRIENNEIEIDENPIY